MKITVVSVGMTLLFGVCLLQGTRTLGVFVQKGPGVKVHVGPRGSVASLAHKVIRAQWCLSLQGSTPRFSW